MSDNNKILNCPACGKEMKKVFCNTQGICVDVCADGCGGIFFDVGEFEKFDEPHEDISQVSELLKNFQCKKVDDVYAKTCPLCSNKMHKEVASYKYDIKYKKCDFCGGVFISYDELEYLRTSFQVEANEKNVLSGKIIEDTMSDILGGVIRSIVTAIIAP